MFRRWRGYLTRRGKFFAVVPVTPALPPDSIDQTARRRAYRTREGVFYGPPVVAATAPAATRARPRTALLLPRRGRFWAVIPAQVVTAPPPWPPSPILRIRVRLASVRRAEYFTIPLVGQAPTPPPPVPPQVLRERVRLPWTRRGRFMAPPWPQATQPAAPVWVPPMVRQRPPGLRPVRRGEFAPVVPRAQPLPSRITSRRPPGQATRRARFWQPPWRFIPPGSPGPLAPRTITQPRRPPVRPTRRAAFIDPPWPSLAHVCTTPRPFDGTTPRPSSGTTARPGSGTTSRPSGGVTTRPDTGMTERPC